MNLDSFEVAPVNGNILIVCLLIYLLIVLQKLACKCTIWVFIFYYLVATAMNGPCSEKVLWRNNSNGCFKIYWFPVKMLGIISLCSNLQFMKIKSFLVRPKNSPKQIKLIWLEIIFNLDFLLFFFFPQIAFVWWAQSVSIFVYLMVLIIHSTMMFKAISQIRSDSYPQGAFSSVQFRSVAQLCPTLCNPMQHARPPCPSPTLGVHSNSCPLSWWCHPTISSSVIPFSSCPQSLPASEFFPMSQLFPWGG